MAGILLFPVTWIWTVIAVTLLSAGNKIDVKRNGDIQTPNTTGVNVFSFHVGNGCEEPEAYTAAIREARYVFDQAKEYGFDMKLLDIGGGFPGHKHFLPLFELVFNNI